MRFQKELGDVSSCDFKPTNSKVTEGDGGAAKAPNLYPAGVVPVLAEASAPTAGCPPPSAIRCHCHPVPLPSGAAVFQGNNISWQFIFAVTAHWLYGNTLGVYFPGKENDSCWQALGGMP